MLVDASVDKLQFSSTIVEKVSNVNMAVGMFSDYVHALAGEQRDACEKGWEVTFDSLAVVKEWGDMIQSAAHQSWEETLANTRKAFLSSVPSEPSIRDKQLLVDKHKRDALLNVSATLSKNGVYKETSSLLELTAKYQKDNPTVVWVPASIAALGRLRSQAKLGSVVAWAVDQIVSFTPTEEKDIPVHAQMIYAKMKTKGVGNNSRDSKTLEVPTFLQQCLDSMVKHKPSAPEPSAPEPSAPETPAEQGKD